jgi:hypothetical protein
LFPAADFDITPSAVLSADLCLRFLPLLREQFVAVDPDDELIPALDKILSGWHYSAIGQNYPVEETQIEIIKSDACCWQLYLNRVIAKKAKQQMQYPAIQEGVLGCLGAYKEILWKDL